jgi:hypothetical protein
VTTGAIVIRPAMMILGSLINSSINPGTPSGGTPPFDASPDVLTSIKT